MTIPRIMEDKRAIDSVWGADGLLLASVHLDGVTAIVPYEESGEASYVTWLAVYMDDEIWQRIPARLCRIEYVLDRKDDD